MGSNRICSLSAAGELHLVPAKRRKGDRRTVGATKESDVFRVPTTAGLNWEQSKQKFDIFVKLGRTTAKHDNICFNMETEWKIEHTCSVEANADQNSNPLLDRVAIFVKNKIIFQKAVNKNKMDC